jgi:hypothetical protein
MTTDRSDIAFLVNDLATSTLPPSSLTGWPEAIEGTLSIAPARTDLLIPYYFWLLSRAQETTLLESTNRILLTRPDDPVALWFSGLALLKDTRNSRTGIIRLRRALQNNVERLFPIDEKTLRQIRQIKLD